MTGKKNILRGMLFALSGNRDYRRHFDLSRAGFWPSFIALGACGPLLILSAYALTRGGQAPAAMTLPSAAVLAVLYLSAFPIAAYLICQVFGTMGTFRSWVIVRNYVMLALTALMAAGFALYLGGILPFKIAYTLGLGLFIGTLLADIRLAQTAGEMGWTGSVWAGCAVAITGLLFVLAALAVMAGY